MKKLNLGSGIPRRGTGAAVATLLALACAAALPARAQTIPSDPKASCTVPAATFSTWFQSGVPAVNGVVNPANSVAFPNTPNCSFYQWSKQMFLWVTSPSPPVYGAGANIFDSPAFFDVSPPDPTTGQRTYLPHTPGFIRVLGVRVAQLGPHGLPVLFDTSGRMLEVERTQTVGNVQLKVVDKTGAVTPVVHAEIAEKGALVLRDANGAAIEPRVRPNPRPIARAPETTGPIQVQKFIVDNLPVFIDPFGNVVQVEQGQAGDGSVLEAQNGSLVYYATMVNDVYAYFQTGLADNQIEPGNPNPTFPTTLSQLNAITSFAAAHGKTFPDPDALAVELKTSWVEAAGLPNLSSYITMTATIPTYNTSSTTTWTANGQKTVQLAMVGMHFVGSTAGHPEMVWATFEHVGNSPNATYQYINSTGTLTTVPQDTSGTWLFSGSGSGGPFDVPHMSEIFPALSIQAASPFTISPSDTIRWKAWGAAFDVSPNPIDGTSAASNSEIISINNSIKAMLPAADIRNNYFMTGATWTIGGAAPNSGNMVGTSQLTNSTMETYQAGTSNTFGSGGINCFDCHSSSNVSIATTGVSHIFGALKPLF
jgi:hypothetical protein